MTNSTGSLPNPEGAAALKTEQLAPVKVSFRLLPLALILAFSWAPQSWSANRATSSNSPPVAGKVMLEQAVSNSDGWSTVTTTYHDPDGWRDLQLVRFALHHQAQEEEPIQLLYDVRRNAVLLKDGGELTPIGIRLIQKVPSARLDVGQTTVRKSGDTLTIRWRLNLESDLSEQVYDGLLWAMDRSGKKSGWHKQSSWQTAVPSTSSIGTSSVALVSAPDVQIQVAQPEVKAQAVPAPQPEVDGSPYLAVAESVAGPTLLLASAVPPRSSSELFPEIPFLAQVQGVAASTHEPTVPLSLVRVPDRPGGPPPALSLGTLPSRLVSHVPAEGTLYGRPALDVDGDGLITVLDLLIISDYLIIHGDGPTPVDQEHIDVNKDGLISLADDSLLEDWLNSPQFIPHVALGLTGQEFYNIPEVIFQWIPIDQTPALNQYRWRLRKPDGSATEWVKQTAQEADLSNEITSDGSYTLELQAQLLSGYWTQTMPKVFQVELDQTAPTTPVVTDDGAFTTDLAQLHAVWISSDPETGIQEYQYQIRSDAPDGPLFQDWTSVGLDTEVTAADLSLQLGVTYFIGVRARNGADLWSETGFSDGIVISEGTIINRETVIDHPTWTPAGSPYIVTESVALTWLLTIQPGVEVRLDQHINLGIGDSSNSGGLMAKGTAANPILFTSNQSIKTPGFWSGIGLGLLSFGGAVMEHCIVEYGGSAGAGAVKISGSFAEVAIRHCTLRHSGGYAVSIRDGLLSPVVLLRFNNMLQNALGGLLNGSDTPVDGVLNWWGDASGPSGTGPGAGGAVEGDVRFSPWLGGLAAPDIPWRRASQSPDSFPPGDGWTTIDAQLLRPVNWTLTFEDAAGNLANIFSGSGSSILQDWFGDDLAQEPLANGIYSYSLQVSDAATGLTLVPLRGMVTLDGSKPVANITSPVQEQLIARGDDLVPVSGTASGDGFQLYRLEVGEGILPTSWFAVTEQTTPVQEGLLAANGLGGLNRDAMINEHYTLRLTVENDAGATAEELVLLRWLRLYNTFSSLAVFSPNGDGEEDTVSLTASSTQAVDWGIDIKNASGSIVQTASGSGRELSYEWDGTDSDGALAPDGTYTIEFSGVDVETGLAPQDESIEVTLDALQLKDIFVTPSSISPHSNETVEVQFHVNNPAEAIIRIYNFLDKELIQTLTLTEQPAGERAVTWDGRKSDGSIAALGAYYFTIEVTDDEGRQEFYNDPDSPIPGRKPNTTSATVSADNFDPYRNDLVHLEYEIDQPATLSIAVIRENQPVIFRLLSENDVHPAGVHERFWDGRGEDGTFHEGDFDIFFDVPARLPVNPIILEKPPPAVVDFRAQAYLIQPLLGEISTFVYSLARAADVTLSVIDPNGSTVRTLLNDIRQSAGQQGVVWDGRTDSGELVAVEGDYTVEVTAVDPGSGLPFRLLGTVVVYK